jgi:mRNA interferase YafQ
MASNSQPDIGYKYRVAPGKLFKKDLVKLRKSGYDISLLDEAIDILAQGKILPRKYKDHKLKGSWTGYRECHITFDWVLIYRIIEDKLILELSRTGSHANALGM